MSDTLYKKERNERTEYYLIRGNEGVMIVGNGEMFTEGGELDTTNIDAEEVSAGDIPDQALENLKEAAEREL